MNHWWPERLRSARSSRLGARRRMSVARSARRDRGDERIITVWQGRVRMRVVSKGRGPALVFFHGPWGLTWDPFLDPLAESFTVYAPDHPGTTPEAHDDIYHLDRLWDLVLCYDELLEIWASATPRSSATPSAGWSRVKWRPYPRSRRRLAMIAPLGFWRDDAPVRTG